MFSLRNIRRFMRGLRFRLMVTYSLFFAVLLIGFTGIFHARLETQLNTQSHAYLENEWKAMKGYLRIERNPDTGKMTAYWYYDADDPDEAGIVFDIRKVYMAADADGNVIPDKAGDPAESTMYEDIGIDHAAEIKEKVRRALAAQKPNKAAEPFWTEKRNSKGELFLIRSGIYRAERTHQPFYAAIGTSVAENQQILRNFMWIYAGVIPGALVLGSFLGWMVAGRALSPVMSVAQAARHISGSNLSLRIPSREAGDELDYLILTFNRMIERLEASFQQMKQFSTDVSHELRTPITAIRGQLEVALFTAKTIDQYREAMFNALQDVDRLSQIVRALLLLSQAESGQLVLQKSRLNLCEVVGDLVEQFQIPAEAAGVRLTSDIPGDCYADADKVQIERMLTNLLSNALKFTREGGRVVVRVRSWPDTAEMIVEDTGRGIPVEFLPHIFDRFYRVPGSGTAPGPEQGLGLGLSFVAWIVKAHDGKVDVESTPGEGTRFTITLPAAAGPETTDVAEVAAQPVAGD